MIALIIFVAFAVYLGLSALMVGLAMRWARRTGRSTRRWGIAAGLFMYLLVFWDHIPTLVLHKYYCATKAGFWIYKTPEQWKAENPGVAETLTWKNLSESFNNHNGTFGIKLNERFVDETRQVYSYILPVKVSIDSVVDIGTNEIMTKRIRVGSGYGSFALGERDWRAIKFWLHAEPCLPGQRKFSELSEQFKTIGREIK